MPFLWGLSADSDGVGQAPFARAWENIEKNRQNAPIFADKAYGKMNSKILIIDDDPVMRTFVAQTLKKHGSDVIEAEGGEEGLELARQQRPGMVICDVRMDGLNGFQTLERIRSLPETVAAPFILMTAQAEPASMREGMGLGADDFLEKPFSAGDLLAAVRAQQKKSEVRKRQAEARLKELRTSISMALPHELFTPLNAVIGYGELLVAMAGDLPPAQTKSMAGEIVEAGERLHRILKNYIAYAQFEMVGMDPDKTAALRKGRCESATIIVRDAVSTQASRADRLADLKLTLEEASLAMSGEHLSKVCEELAGNCFKFSNGGSGVNVSGKVIDRVYQLDFQDHGRGMKPEQIDAIGAYSQFDRDKHEQQGIGLGLAISRRIAEVHGGSLKIASNCNGTLVVVTIPLA